MSRKPKAASQEDDPLNVGRRLATLRRQYGMSQRELARRAGVTNGTISGIESNRANPQVGSLRKILEVFPITMSSFFSLDLDAPPQIFFTKQDLVEIGGEGLSLRLVAARNRARRLQLTHEHYAPGADTGVPMLSHEGEEAGIVIRGALEVFVGSQRVILHPGEAYYFQSSIPHRFRNAGEGECEVVSAATPATF